MTATRSKKSNNSYRKHQKHVERPAEMCAFCEMSSDQPQFISQSNYFKVIQNIFPYTLWDSQTVRDHLLVVPIKHTDTLSDISAAGAQDYVRTISKYESKGYSVWARPPGSINKSLVHQHTHLIKLSGKGVRFLMYIKRPYLRFLIK